MSPDILQTIIIAVMTGLVSGGVGAIGTVKTMRVHIDYIRESIERHDARLRAVEREQHKMTGALNAQSSGPLLNGG